MSNTIRIRKTSKVNPINVVLLILLIGSIVSTVFWSVICAMRTTQVRVLQAEVKYTDNYLQERHSSDWVSIEDFQDWQNNRREIAEHNVKVLKI